MKLCKSPEEYLALGQKLYEWIEAYRASGVDYPNAAEWAESAAKLDVSQSYLWRVYGYYRLYNLALGFGAEVYRLGPRKLDSLRSQIDWDHRESVIKGGLGGKLNAAQARALIRKELHALDARAEGAPARDSRTAPR